MKDNPIYNKGYDDGFADGANQFEDKLLAEAIANYMIVNGTGSTTSGNRIFSFEDICNHFNITKEHLDNIQENIIDELISHPHICDQDGIWIEEDSFNLMFFLGYCNIEDKD